VNYSSEPVLSGMDRARFIACRCAEHPGRLPQLPAESDGPPPRGKGEKFHVERWYQRTTRTRNRARRSFTVARAVFIVLSFTSFAFHAIWETIIGGSRYYEIAWPQSRLSVLAWLSDSSIAGPDPAIKTRQRGESLLLSAILQQNDPN